MMATRLTDSELAARVRAANQQRAARQAERRRADGLVQLNVWVRADTRAALADAAAATGYTLSTAAECLLVAGLHPAHEVGIEDCWGPDPISWGKKTGSADTTTPADTTTTVYTGVVSSRDALMAEVGKLLDEGHTGADIARQLNASGKRTASGAAFTGGNLLRDYRAWSKKRDAAQ